MRAAARYTLLVFCISLIALFTGFLLFSVLVGLAERDVIFVAH